MISQKKLFNVTLHVSPNKYSLPEFFDSSEIGFIVGVFMSEFLLEKDIPLTEFTEYSVECDDVIQIQFTTFNPIEINDAIHLFFFSEKGLFLILNKIEIKEIPLNT